MKILMTIYLTVVQLAKQVWSLPQAIALAYEKRRRQTAPNAQELDRLDRLRNPSKYQGR
jgi:hypothetical protein